MTNFQEIIENRRAVNFFDPNKNVPDELLNKIIELAAKSPSSFNLQPWSVMVLRDKEEKMRLRKHAFNQEKVSEAPVTLIVLADMDAWQKGHPFVEKNLREMVKSGMAEEGKTDWFYQTTQNLYGATRDKQLAYAVKNTGFFAMSLMLAAKSLGLDTHPMDGFSQSKVKAEFNIPDNYWIPLLLSIGYFKEGATLPPAKWRKTLDEIIVKFD